MKLNNLYFKKIIVIVRLCFAILIGFSIYSQFNSNTLAVDFTAVNFFSYFTIQSNILTAIILVVSGLSLLLSNKEKKLVSLLRGSSVLYMSLTAIIFAILLTEIAAKDPYILPWANTIFHRIVPLFVIADWVLLPPKNKLNYKDIFFWFIFPLLWLLYSYLRVFLTGWYSYHFLDPNQVGGPFGVLTYIAIMTGGIFLLGLMVITSANLVKKIFYKT